ncbi:MAG: type VI secretion system ATPase TssH [bacterium]|nr:type VI secretion system ATPase TssH [bacterium]
MVNVDIKSLLRRLNGFCTRSLEAAAGLCVSRTHYEVTIEHMLLKMLEEPAADLQHILRHFELEPTRLQRGLQRAIEELRAGNAGKPVFSPLLMEWFQEGWLLASIDLGLNEIRSGVLLTTLIANPGRYTAGTYLDNLEKIHHEELRRRLLDIVAGSSEGPARAVKEEAAAPGEKRGPRADTALGRYTIDFTGRAREGEIDPVFGRDQAIRQMVDILARRRKNNPIVVGEAGVGKTAVVEGLALRIVEGNVPSVLSGVEILGLDMGLLQAGAGVKGEFENRLKSVISEVKGSPTPIIMFIDEAHTLIGAGGAAGGGDAANLLKPALARGELRTIAATTWSEYKKYFEKDAALARRFQVVKIDEPSEDGAIVMLRGLRDKYESSHKVHIHDAAVVAASRLSSRYISGRLLPDKAVDLLDTCAARVKVALTTKPDVLEDIGIRIETLERELEALRRDMAVGVLVETSQIEELEQQIAKSRDEFADLEARWQREKEAVEKVLAVRERIEACQGQAAAVEETEAAAKEKKPSTEKPTPTAVAEDMDALRQELDAALVRLQEIQGKDPLIHMEVNPEVVAKVVADWTGIPVGKMVKDEAQSILNLDKELEKRIKGQPSALETVSRGIRASKSGLGNPHAPIGVFLFVGPSGVGKTELGLTVADTLFGGERFMVTINMSEFQEKHTVSRLIGSPPGYVGFGEGGVLTEAVRQRPYSVVLLDEVEKADPEVMNLFYQVFDKGMLSDGEGRVIDFKNTIIFMTSNLGSDIITSMSGGDTQSEPAQIIEAIRPVLSRHFKPALLARMTIVPFYTISMEAMKNITQLKLNQLAGRLHSSHKMAFEYDDQVVNQIAERCTEVETGARNIDHIMQGTLLPHISTEILQRMTEGPLPDKLHLGINKDGGFIFEFSDQAQAKPSTGKKKKGGRKKKEALQ